MHPRVVTTNFLQVQPTPIVPPKGESLQCIPEDNETRKRNLHKGDWPLQVTRTVSELVLEEGVQLFQKVPQPQLVL